MRLLCLRSLSNKIEQYFKDLSAHSREVSGVVIPIFVYAKAERACNVLNGWPELSVLELCRKIPGNPSKAALTSLSGNERSLARYLGVRLLRNVKPKNATSAVTTPHRPKRLLQGQVASGAPMSRSRQLDRGPYDTHCLDTQTHLKYPTIVTTHAPHTAVDRYRNGSLTIPCHGLRAC